VRQLLNRARNALRSAAAAVTPMPLLTRLASGDSTEPVAARVAEMVGVGAAGGGALVFKLCATALVTGAVVGGVAVTPDGGRDDRRGAGVGAEPAEAAEERSADSDGGNPVPAPSGRGSDRAGAHAEHGGSHGEEHATVRDDDHSGPGGGGGDDASEGPGGGAEAPDDDHSGPGGGGEPEPEPKLDPELDDHSGPGGGGETPEPLMEEAVSVDNSGPGGGGGDDALEPDNSGPGSAP
jgi:hypothetical protein